VKPAEKAAETDGDDAAGGKDAKPAKDDAAAPSSASPRKAKARPATYKDGGSEAAGEDNDAKADETPPPPSGGNGFRKPAEGVPAKATSPSPILRTTERQRVREQERKASARFHLSEARRLLREGDAPGAKKECVEARNLDPEVGPEVDQILRRAGDR